MRLINDILYIEFAEMEACGIPRNTLLHWKGEKDPADKRRTIFNYLELKPKYKELLTQKYDDPYLFVHYQAIKKFLRTDVKAIDYFTAYRTNENTALPARFIKEYTNNANWLNLIKELESNWRICKKALYMQTKPQLYHALCKLFIIEDIKLPRGYCSLKQKVAIYKTEGYASLVTKRFGNSNSKKVKHALNQALLIEMLSHSMQYSDVFIAEKYNLVIKELNAGYKTISAVTVGNYRKKHDVEVDAPRLGKDAWYNKVGKVIHRKRASMPLMLINSDDNELDVYFRQIKTNKAGHQVTHYYYRPYLYIVIDTFNDYILGYAIGDTNTQNLIKAAYLNAANHVKQLTGARYLWHQIQTDRWGIDKNAKNDFSQYFSNQAEFTPTMLGNSRGKVIEQVFRGHWSAKLKELFPINYSGTNITSKGQIPREWLEANKKNFPKVEDAEILVADFIEEMRQLRDARTGLSKQQQWLDAFNAMPDDKKRPITDEQHLLWLGYHHVNSRNGKHQLNTLSNNGLLPVLNGVKMVYEVPAEFYLDTIGTTCKVKYDPYDLSKVLAISLDEKTRLVCKQYELMPMAKADYTEATPEYLNSRIGEKVGHVKLLAQKRQHRLELLARAKLDAQSILTAGVLKKEIKHAATKLLDIDYENFETNDDFDMDALM